MALRRSASYQYKDFLNLEAPIIPGKSIGGIDLQMHISHLKDWILYLTTKVFHDKDSKVLKAQVNFGLEVEYSVNDGVISFIVDIVSGTVFRLTCGKGYKGKLLNTIGIGSPFHELLKLGKSFDVYNTYHVMSPEFPGLYIELPEGYYDYDGELKDLPDYPIEKIGIFSRWKDGNDLYSSFYGESFER